MEANELRIGNVIDYLGKQVVVTTSIIHAVNRIVHPSVMYKGVPLTEQVLVDCGFVKNKNGEPCIEINDIASHLELMVGVDNFHYPSFTQMPQGDEERTVFFNRINSIHQLQNLYFALTGTELTYKK